VQEKYRACQVTIESEFVPDWQEENVFFTIG